MIHTTNLFLASASGFIGSYLYSYLIKDSSINLFSCTRSISANSSPANITGINLNRRDDVARLVESIPPCDVIIYSAAAINYQIDDLNISDSNCAGIQNITYLQKCWSSSLVIYISSIGVIGAPQTLPISEFHPVMPPTSYHASKLFGEHIVRLLSSKETKAVSLRISAPVGAGMPRHRFLPTLVDRALLGMPILLKGSGARIQDYIDIRDIAKLISLLVEKPVSGVFNVASGNAISNRSLAEKVISVLDSSSNIIFNNGPDPEENHRWIISCEKLWLETKFKSTVSIEESIRSLVS